MVARLTTPICRLAPLHRLRPPYKKPDRSALPQPAARHWSQARSADREISGGARGREEIAPTAARRRLHEPAAGL